MQSINFNDGYKEYQLNENDKRTIRVCVTDFNLPARLKKCAEKIDRMLNESKNISSDDEIVELDNKAKKIIDEAVGSQVCKTVFGDTSCFTLTGDDDGCVAISFLKAFMGLIEQEVKSVTAAKNITLEDKTAKYTQHIQPELSEMTDEQRAFMEFLASRNNGAVK